MSETTNETTKKPTSGLAIAGLVLGIIAILGSFIPIINNMSFVISIVGGILAIVALVGATKGKNGGKGMAIAGVVLAVVSIMLVLITQSAFKSALDKTSENLKSGSQPVESSQQQSNDQGNNQGEQSGQTENKEAKDYSNMALGETVTLEDGLTITVNSVNRGLTKYDGSPLVSVNVTYTNTGDKSASFNTFDWKSEDANGVQQSTYFNMDGENRLESGKLSPGGTVTGNLFFEGEPIRVLYFSNMFQNDSKIGWSLG